MSLTSEQQSFMNAHFQENIPEGELNESKFKELKTSEELHYLKYSENLSK